MKWVALVLIAVVVSVPLPAHATGGSSLTFERGSGLDTTRIRVVTSAPCPASTTHIVGTATGRGFPKEGAVVIGNSDLDFSRSAPFAVAMSDTMAGIAADNGTTLGGVYRVVLKCIDVTTTVMYAAFTGVVTFTDQHHWSAPKPSPARAAEVAKGIAAGLGTALPPTGPLASLRAQAQATATARPQASGAPGASGSSTTRSSAGHGSTGGSSLLWRLGLAVAGTGMLSLAVGTWRRERRERRGVVA